MKRILFAALALAGTACSANDTSEVVSSSDQDLNGTLSPTGFLAKRNIGFSVETDRESETSTYYNTTGTSASGSGAVISSALKTLGDFRTAYGFNSAETNAKYYNRGDLGLGRDMHCIDRLSIDGQIACYVTNYAAGDGEFTFGQSRDIAFSNMDANSAAATVAMVYRSAAAANKKIIFMVYGPNSVADPDINHTALINRAALDRHGLNFDLEFTGNHNSSPDPITFGIPGKNFNNHIPSNCLNCHGGNYDVASHSVTGSFFLPFDLDQLEYQSASQDPRASSTAQTAFRNLNQMVRRVAEGMPSHLSVTKQIDGWYSNPSGLDVLSGSFDAGFVPPGWRANTDTVEVYQKVVRPSCRGCHMTLPTSTNLTFDTSSQFVPRTVALDVCSNLMPHALQTQREFWFSAQPIALRKYFSTLGGAGASSAVDLLDGNGGVPCGPGTISTLDPQLIGTVTQ